LLPLTATGVVTVPADANAHLLTTGLGPLYDGAVHFLMSPEAILPVAALGIFAGLQGLSHARAAVVMLPVAWILCGFAAVFLGPLEFNPIYESVPLILLGGLAAANPPAAPWLTALLALMLGLIEGYVFGAATSGIRDGIISVFGTVSVVFILIVLVTAAVMHAKWGWSRIAVRVVGSWTAASGVLLLGWGLR
jgi:hydrogenase/urease accessory protein HupE